MSNSDREEFHGSSHTHSGSSGHHSSHSHSDSRSHHGSHSHHHRYRGPRSSQPEGLSDEYMTALTEDALRSSRELENQLLEEEKAFAEAVSRSIEAQTGENTGEQAGSPGGDRGNSEESDSTGCFGKRPGKGKKHRDSFTRAKRRKKILIRILLGIVLLLLLLVGTFFWLRYMGENNLKKNIVETPVEVVVPEEVAEEVEEEDNENLVVYNGERYWYNEDVITVLCIGVDREEFSSPDDMVIGGNGQADADVLVIFDKKNGKISFLNISRDCMVDLDRYNIQGQYLDTVKEQLCLSFAFGNGQQTSCENTALSVSRLLYGIPINAYVAIDFNSIGTLNDAVGGVSVPVTEDIAHLFPGTTVGALVNLVGSEAVTYVRTRDTELLDSNNTRMARQKQYILAFLRKALEQIKEDPTKALALFNSVSDNMVTSIKLSEVTYFGTFFAQHGFKEENLTSLQGEVVLGEDDFAQFIPDEKALFETVLNLFYEKE